MNSRVTIRPLPKRDLVLSPLGMGTAPIGDLYGTVEEAVASATVRRALDLGVRYYDTAPLYGRGLAERRLGEALKGAACDGATMQDVVLSSKVGRLLRPARPGDEFRVVADMTEAGIRRSLEESLARLGVDHLDVVYLHDPDDFEDAARAVALPTLLELRRQGLIEAVGVGMNQAAMLERFVEDLDLDVVLLAGRYTLLDQSGRRLLDLCAARGVGVVIGGAFNSGVLADPRPGARYDYQPAADRVLARARAMADVCASYGARLSAAALQFPWAHPAVVSVLQGPEDPDQLEANVSDFQADIPEGCWAELHSRRLLPADAVLP